MLLGMYSKIFFVQIVKKNKCFSTKLPVVQRKLKFNGNVAVKDDATWAVHFFLLTFQQNYVMLFLCNEIFEHIFSKLKPEYIDIGELDRTIYKICNEIVYIILRVTILL